MVTRIANTYFFLAHGFQVFLCNTNNPTSVGEVDDIPYLEGRL